MIKEDATTRNEDTTDIDALAIENLPEATFNENEVLEKFESLNERMSFIQLCKTAFLLCIPNFLFMFSVSVLGNASSSLIAQSSSALFRIIGKTKNYLAIFYHALIHSYVAAMENIGTHLLSKHKYSELANLKNNCEVAVYIFSGILMVIQYLVGWRLTEVIYSIPANKESDFKIFFWTLLPAGPIDGRNNNDLRYFNLIRKPYINSVSFIIGAVVNVATSIFFINTLDLGMIGVSLSFIVSKISISISYAVAHIYFDPYHKFSKFFQKKTFDIRSIWKYSKRAIKSCIALFLIWVNVPIQFLIVNFLKDDDSLSIYLVTLSVYNFIYSLHFSYENCVSLIISNLILKTSDIKHLVIRLLLIGMFFLSILLSFGLIFTKQIIYLFVDDAQRSNDNFIAKVSNVLLFSFLVSVFDLLQISCAGFLRGVGLSKITLIVTIVVFYLVAPLLSYIFAFVLEMKIFGIWLALGISYFICFIVYLVFIIITDLEKVRQKLLETNHSSLVIT